MNKKRWIICADGTWNEPDQTDQGLPSPTNVSKLAAAVLPYGRDQTPQSVFYHWGVGERGGVKDHVFGGAFGDGLSKNIRELYFFLVENYSPGDELFLFGFSRGAYTARSLAGLIRNCGILMPKYAEKYREAYELYRTRGGEAHPNAPQSIVFRNNYSWPNFNIKFIGVWDTVGSLGIPSSNCKYFEFHDIELSSYVDFAYQALAIDEIRKFFVPSLWSKQPSSPQTQVLEQIWFPGAHCNVGGGYNDCGLSDCALDWMWGKAEGCGLALDSAQKPRPNFQGLLRNSMTWYYHLLGSISRNLGSQLPNSYERISQAAKMRYQVSADYRPANLISFMEKYPELVERSLA